MSGSRGRERTGSKPADREAGGLREPLRPVRRGRTYGGGAQPASWTRWQGPVRLESRESTTEGLGRGKLSRSLQAVPAGFDGAARGVGVPIVEVDPVGGHASLPSTACGQGRQHAGRWRRPVQRSGGNRRGGAEVPVSAVARQPFGAAPVKEQVELPAGRCRRRGVELHGIADQLAQLDRVGRPRLARRPSETSTAVLSGCRRHHHRGAPGSRPPPGGQPQEPARQVAPRPRLMGALWAPARR